ncbi:DUF7620 family protein [Rathayibacter sp. VKM Ac-2630]|uniref:DUF7620 family protein n=1 Tax=Rathayibacter sp. VKM Ac-2630 TaxID=1938617 RepID=UPI00111555D3|nr:hypothetical protein [Rathayibacter sp. VKM Ac-2630]
MRWWKRTLATAETGVDEAAAARKSSEESLEEVKKIVPHVEEVTRSLDITRTNNHFAIRIAAAYGYAQPGKAPE